MKKIPGFLVAVIVSMFGSCTDGQETRGSVAGIDLSDPELETGGDSIQHIRLVATNPIESVRAGVFFRITTRTADDSSLDLFFAATTPGNHATVVDATRAYQPIFIIVIEDGLPGGESIQLQYDVDSNSIGTLLELGSPTLLGVW